MQSFEITQKVLAIGPTYQVRSPASNDVLMTVKGKVLTATPKLTMVEGAEGNTVAQMNGNFFKTKFQIFGSDQREIGSLEFPLIQLKKSFTLKVGTTEYKADGGLLGRGFRVTDAQGETVLEIQKELALKDKFSVLANDRFPAEVALLAAVAIDQKFFENDN